MMGKKLDLKCLTPFKLNEHLIKWGKISAIPLFTKEWKGSPATPKLILALIFPLIENTGQLPKYFWEYLRELRYIKTFYNC